ncbi:hypothetical protein [Fodinibius salsisoli]|uniref:Uncharacterized protein n=1 Tax=Fodinibius salsisoli TaxID=2820877 RepID=A0ABT3PHJ1_9BACT|nr:hypothetical protein [Fodinibius salsisoli]MCW9705253.1 hypothetical protein [Fodinibius salsisoli]
MKIILIILSVLGLALTVIPSVLVFVQDISLQTHQNIMVFGMLLWFGTSPFWMKEQKL